MTAIVYVTNTGSSKRYAEMLSEKTGYDVYSLSEAEGLGKDAEVIFIGWVMGGSVQGLAEAREKFTLKAVCPVGMMKGEKAAEDVKAKNAITEPMFPLLGDFHIDSLKGMYRMMMGMMLKMMKSKLKENPVPDGDKAIEAIEKGIDGVSGENLTELLGWLEEHK